MDDDGFAAIERSIRDAGPLLSTEDIANLFKIKKRTAAGWVHQGRMQGAKFSDRAGWLVPEAEVVRFAREIFRAPQAA
jgi:excisionase family DNA binding protein